MEFRPARKSQFQRPFDWPWNTGVLTMELQIWELVQGQMCFDGQATAQADYSSEAHLAQMIAILGQFPKSLLERSTSAKHFFDAQGLPLQSERMTLWTKYSVLIFC